ncbi:MAG: VWA domain-containing protein [Pyrinomonadaceae bacterium]
MRIKSNAKITGRSAQEIPLVVARLFVFTLLFSIFTSHAFAQAVGETETIRIDTDLVNLNISVFNRNSRAPISELQTGDFIVLENNTPQPVTFFAAATTPFDLVLLLDLSGSTANKIEIVRRSAKHFVEAARPSDRIGIVTFADTWRLVSPLTTDRAALLARIKKIKPYGSGTKFWDALAYLLQTLDGARRTASRRSAIIAMTDGIDNAIADVPGDGSETDFGKLLEMVRRTDFSILPIYLDTEREMVKAQRVPASAYFYARQQLQLLAEESGSPMYTARKLEDLQGVYTQVIRDLSTVYSIGYHPLNKQRDGAYRRIVVRLASRKDLIARTRSGYYAKH